MRIVGIERSEFATNHYRILQPLYKLYEHGLADILTIKEQELELESSQQRIMEADLVVVYSPSNEQWLEAIKVLQRAGKIIVADYDDDPFNTSPLSPAYKYFGTEEVAYQWPDGKTDMLWSQDMTGSKGEQDFFNIERNIRHRDLFRANFKKSDLITTTNPHLAESFKTINKNTVILPNLMDFSLYPKCEMKKRNIRIGWQGGSSHYEDLYIIHKAIKDIIKKYPNVTFVYFGDMRFKGLFSDIPQDRIEYHSWVKNVVYPYKLATLNLDIGLCPLVDNEFNRKKTAIKYFEYSIVGAATIASAIPPYSDVITSGRDGILVPEHGWYEAIETVSRNRKTRERLAYKAYDNVYTNHNADTKAHLWLEAYDKLLKRDLAEV